MKRTEENTSFSLPHKRRRVTQSAHKNEKEVDVNHTRKSIILEDPPQSLSLRQRRRNDVAAVIGIEPTKEAGSDGETSPNKSLYATPKTTTSIYETPPAYPTIVSKRYEGEDSSPQRKASESKNSKSIAVLGLDPSKPEQHGAAQETVTVNYDDDDEAPETITKEIARERVKRLNIEAANASKKQVVAEKAKRREKDTRLKQQANSARRGNNPKIPLATDAEIKEAVAADKVHKSGRKKRNIPEYLPEDVLAMEPQINLPITLENPKEDQPKTIGRNRNIFFHDQKAPRDVKRGSKKVRVLRKENKLLPPKANAQSRYIRESWLKGRPGKRGEAMFERRKYSTPFLVN